MKGEGRVMVQFRCSESRSRNEEREKEEGRVVQRAWNLRPMRSTWLAEWETRKRS